MIAREIGARRALANPVHDDSKTNHPLKNHTSEGITHIPERHIAVGTIRVLMNTGTGGLIHQRNDDPTVLPWTS